MGMLKIGAPSSCEFGLPCRLSWLGTDVVLMGTPGASGDAGWGVVVLKSREALDRLAQAYPQARMPCWTRMGL